MLDAEFERCGVRLVKQGVYCTMTTYKERYPDRRPGLAAAAGALGVERGSGRSAAIEDAILVACLYQALTSGPQLSGERPPP